MDELSGFLNAPKQLLQRENALLKEAALVFTGGPSLYQSKQPRHEAVYCFPSSVDSVHFGQARDVRIEHRQQQALAHPRLGFYGVIDERIDLDLIARLADAHPEWRIVMVGPVVKIDPAHLPRRPQIHYFAQQSYTDLPRFLAGWDVCLLPFALNPATRYISPTKTLEYMAAEKPIVSTPITDVVVPYGDIVYVGADPPAFIDACEQALHAAPAERARRAQMMRDTVALTSWDATAAQMHELIENASTSSAKKKACSLGLPSVPPAQKPIVILGAGPTGLSAAYHAGENSLLLEQNDTVGGWCRSIEDHGFTFDCAGHIMFSNDPYVHQLYKLLLGDNVHWQDREAWIFSKRVYTRYPFQGALYGLPPEVLKECIIGAIEARFGPLKTAVAQPSSPAHGANGSSRRSGTTPSTCKAESLTDCCADGLAESSVPLVDKPRGSIAEAPRNFEDFIYKVWGKGVARHFALPYNRKLWAVPLTEMETSWLGGRVPLPDLEEMIDGALRPVPRPLGPNARFGYPLRGGFQALVAGFVPHLRGEVKLNSSVIRVNPSRREVVLGDGTTYGYQQLISTMPLPALIAMISEAPTVVRESANNLRHVSVRCVNLGVGREKLTEKHWIYFPEEDSVFHRIFVQGNASPHCNPPGGFGVTCEITYSPHKPLPCEGEALIQRCIDDCIKVGLIRAEDPILCANQVDMPYAYVVYDHARSANVALIREWLSAHDIILAGRYSEWQYYNSDHAFLAGRKAAEAALNALNQNEAGIDLPVAGRERVRAPLSS